MRCLPIPTESNTAARETDVELDDSTSDATLRDSVDDFEGISTADEVVGASVRRNDELDVETREDVKTGEGSAEDSEVETGAFELGVEDGSARELAIDVETCTIELVDLEEDKVAWIGGSV